MLKKRGVEVAGVVEEAALAGIAGAGAIGVGVIQRLEVPAAIGRERGDRIAAAVDQLPQLLGRAHPPGKRQLMPTIAIGSLPSAARGGRLDAAQCAPDSSPTNLPPAPQALVVETQGVAGAAAGRRRSDGCALLPPPGRRKPRSLKAGSGSNRP